jgi:hypothetical protein
MILVQIPIAVRLVQASTSVFVHLFEDVQFLSGTIFVVKIKNN